MKNDKYWKKQLSPKKEENTIILDRSKVPYEKCSICDTVAELRPYGKNGTWICFPCGMKDETETIKNFSNLLNMKENNGT